MADDTTDTTPDKVIPEVKEARSSGCPVCGSNDIHALNGPLRQCINCASTINGDGTVATEAAVDSVERVLGTTPAQPLPEAALIEQEGAEDLDRVRGTTPPQPLPVDAYNDPRVLGTTPPQPVPASEVPVVVYGSSDGTSTTVIPDSPSTGTSPDPEPAGLLKPKIAEKVANAKDDEAAAKAAAKMPSPESVGDQPVTDESYSTTSGFPTGETKIVTPGETPAQPDIASE